MKNRVRMKNIFFNLGIISALSLSQLNAFAMGPGFGNGRLFPEGPFEWLTFAPSFFASSLGESIEHALENCPTATTDQANHQSIGLSVAVVTVAGGGATTVLGASNGIRVLLNKIGNHNERFRKLLVAAAPDAADYLASEGLRESSLLVSIRNSIRTYGEENQIESIREMNDSDLAFAILELAEEVEPVVQDSSL